MGGVSVCASTAIMSINFDVEFRFALWQLRYFALLVKTNRFHHTINRPANSVSAPSLLGPEVCSIGYVTVWSIYTALTATAIIYAPRFVVAALIQ